MNIKEDRAQLHSALADLVCFLEAYPHPMKGMISIYMKDAIDAINGCTIGKENSTEVVEPPMLEKLKYENTQEDEVINSVVSALKVLGYGTREATNLAVSVTGDTVEERIKNALSSSTILRPPCRE